MKIGFEAYERVSAMLGRANSLTYTYVKQEMTRFGKRFRKKVVRERMSGRPGLNAKKLAKGKNLRAWTYGESLHELTTSSRISRLLTVHERGATIRPKGGKWLYLRSGGHIFAKVRQVVIPARLGFMDTWRSSTPDAKDRIRKATQRAAQVAGERNAGDLKKIL